MKKKNFRRGASIVIAILIFMLCALAGVTALTMSMSNGGRYSHGEDRQPYYAVSSAALLLLDMMDKTSYTSYEIQYTYQRHWEYDTTDPNNAHPQDDGYQINLLKKDDETGAYVKDSNGKPVLKTRAELGAEKNSDNKDNKSNMNIANRGEGESKSSKDTRHALESSKLYDEIRDWCDKLVPYLSVPQEWYSTLDYGSADDEIKTEDFMPTSQLDFEFTVSSPEAGDVKARLIMSSNYNLIISLSYNEGGKSLFAVNIYWEADVTEKTDSEDADYDYGGGKEGWQTITQTKVVTVTYNKSRAKVSRGETTAESTQGDKS